MAKSSKKNKYLSSKAIFKEAIRSLLFRYGTLTAKQIQESLGLKQQTTYNYLNELVDEGEIEVKYEKLQERVNLSRAYYSHKPPLFGEQNGLLYTERIVETSQPLDSLLEQIQNTSDSTLAMTLQIKAAINRMTDEEVENFVKCDPTVWGYFSTTLLLTDEKYSELQTEFKELLNRLEKKWAKEASKGSAGNVFTFIFYKTVFSAD